MSKPREKLKAMYFKSGMIHLMNNEKRQYTIVYAGHLDNAVYWLSTLHD